jgi:hypothetical protein
VKPVVAALSSNSGKIEETYKQLRNTLPETRAINKVIDSFKIKSGTSTDGQMPDNGVIDIPSTTN